MLGSFSTKKINALTVRHRRVRAQDTAGNRSARCSASDLKNKMSILPKIKIKKLKVLLVLKAKHKLLICVKRERFRRRAFCFYFATQSFLIIKRRLKKD